MLMVMEESQQKRYGGRYSLLEGVKPSKNAKKWYEVSEEAVKD